MRSRVRHYYPALGGAVHIRVRASTGELCRLGDASPELRAASVAGIQIEWELANRGLVFSVIVGATISPRAQLGRDQREQIPPNMYMLHRAFLPCQRRHMFIVFIGITLGNWETWMQFAAATVIAVAVFAVVANFADNMYLLSWGTADRQSSQLA
jgi:hypothetical protein